ncbi:hypothetical protein Ndes2526B_g00804 [Nannochloris sp. 'desiccata']|nr:hypothetical protein KSW81_004090 [Chlorella desiccata (nom. nud.)]KAH7624602.1 putative U1 small nuclear ribonucleoprotein C [Chlorella desiccata (nom. nud.)]
MPRYYCDYCDAYLTHDSPIVRRQHNTGYKHKSNVKSYFLQFDEENQARLIAELNGFPMPPAAGAMPPPHMQHPGMMGGGPPRPGMGPPPPHMPHQYPPQHRPGMPPPQHYGGGPPPGSAYGGPLPPRGHQPHQMPYPGPPGGHTMHLNRPPPQQQGYGLPPPAMPPPGHAPPGHAPPPQHMQQRPPPNY